MTRPNLNTRPALLSIKTMKTFVYNSDLYVYEKSGSLLVSFVGFFEFPVDCNAIQPTSSVDLGSEILIVC